LAAARQVGDELVNSRPADALPLRT